MNRELALKVADAVLYEGYMLYPYRRSALKNHHRWTFGILYPPGYEEVRRGTERSCMHSECLLRTRDDHALALQLRCLQLLTNKSNGAGPNSNEGIERSVEFSPDLCAASPQRFGFSFSDGESAIQQEMSGTQRQVQGAVIVTIQAIEPALIKVSIDVTNESQSGSAEKDRDTALIHALLSAHLILTAINGDFVSLLDPPEELCVHANTCRNVGSFPVLVGNEGEHDMMLCSPIILYDYPQIAPESAGDFFDSTEMDEMLTLRVMTLTDQEKGDMRSAGHHTRNLLERTEQSAREQLMKTHGTMRNGSPASEHE
jgi:hypothetical protein